MVEISRAPHMTDRTLADLLEGAGFEDVTVAVKTKLPCGPWPRSPKLKRIGAINLLASLTGYHSYGMLAFTRILGMDTARADKLCNDAVAAAQNKNLHNYTYLCVPNPPPMLQRRADDEKLCSLWPETRKSRRRGVMCGRCFEMYVMMQCVMNQRDYVRCPGGQMPKWKCGPNQPIKCRCTSASKQHNFQTCLTVHCR